MSHLSVLKNSLEFGNEDQIEALNHLNRGEECDSCCDEYVLTDVNGYPIKEDQYSEEVYYRPFDEESHILYFCSEECLDRMTDSSWSDFRYFWCNECNRWVCEQNPSNGWHGQYRELDCELVCLKCYEEIILNNGISREKFEEGKLHGMFLSTDNSEAREAGFKEVDGFVDYRVGDEKPVCDKAMSLIDDGYKVIVAYESMAIGGLEGYITLMVKK
jgi:hypothetical protein